MGNPNKKPEKDPPKAFSEEANQKRHGFLEEYIDFLRHNKKWWLLPIILILLLVGILLVLGGTAIAPLIYPLF